MMKKIHNRTKYFIDRIPAVDIARQNGISKHCFTDRVGKLGWDVKKACTYKKISNKELAIKMGVDIKKIQSLRKSFSYEELVKIIETGEKNEK